MERYALLRNNQLLKHRMQLVNPSDPSVHTDLKEGIWAHSKARFRNMRGASDELFSTDLNEFVWRKQIRVGAFVYIFLNLSLLS